MKKIFTMVLCFVVCCILSACGAEKIVWSELFLGELLPEPPINNGEVHDDSDKNLWIDINEVSDKQFVDYIKDCKEKGFTVDAELSSSSYNAYNAEGYKLTLSHYGSDADMSIQLEAPMEMTAITWPTSIAGKQLPTPKYTTGKFSYEHDDNFFVYVGNTSSSDYAEYVNACSAKGFNVDYSKGDDYYYANNSEGWHIDIRYIGNNIMSIRIEAPSNDNPNSNTTTPDTTNKGDLDPNFKAAMDSYEKFIDEYVAFMKKYSADPTDMSILADYADYMNKYADYLKDFEKWEDEEMNDAETAYYIDVQARVNKKLLEVAQ